MTASTAKSALRRHYRQRRRQALSQDGAAITAGITAALARLLPGRLAPGQRLGLYWPLAGEVDLRALAERAPVALPAVAGQRLLYRCWQPGDALEADGCGIPAPPAGSEELAADGLALLLIPALAIDHRGVRLGYGGGWYDRLRQDRPWRQVEALAVLPQACICPRLPREPWDIPLDGWVSERGWERARPESP